MMSSGKVWVRTCPWGKVMGDKGSLIPRRMPSVESPTRTIGEHTCLVLEFDRIREILAGYAASELGRDLSLRSFPSIEVSQVEEELGLVSEMRTLLEAGDDLSLDRVRDVRASLRKAEVEGASLEPQELLELRETLWVVRTIRALFRKGNDYPLLEGLVSRMVALGTLERRIDRAIDPAGRVQDGASSGLTQIRRELKRTRDRLHDKLDALVRELSEGGVLQEPIITLRDNRYVIPVKEEHRGRVEGVVHDHSASGATVFIEPLATIELNNRLRELQVEERREINRILLELTDLVRGYMEHLQVNVEVLAQLDLIYAKARMAQGFEAVKPRLNCSGHIRIVRGRHPLLELKKKAQSGEVVPLDLELGGDFRTLVITGPNAGGKTVALKTVGLLTLMVQAGMHIPAEEGTEIAVFEQIFADIGDEQSIEADLSTFSSHIRLMVEFLDKADRNTLVLLDELGAGTDPDLGAALGMAILEGLTRRGACTIATTHHGALKAFAYGYPGIENGSMEFDSHTLQPTYRFRLGIPGGSYTFQIATQLGLSSEIVNKAAGYLQEGRQNLEGLIAELNHHLKVYEEKRKEAERREAELERLLNEYHSRVEQIESEEKEIKRRAYEQAQTILVEANALVERTVAAVRQAGGDRERIREARKSLVAEQTRIEQEMRRYEVPRRVSLEEVHPGKRVFVGSLRSEGEIVSGPDSQGRVGVQVGNVKVEVALSELAEVEGGEVSPDKRGSLQMMGLEREVRPEIDLRGLGSEEALALLDKYLDDAYLVGLESVRIIHGKGTGALRHRVSHFLEHDPRVKAQRLGDWSEGGNGVTVVELK